MTVPFTPPVGGHPYGAPTVPGEVVQMPHAARVADPAAQPTEIPTHPGNAGNAGRSTTALAVMGVAVTALVVFRYNSGWALAGALLLDALIVLAVVLLAQPTAGHLPRPTRRRDTATRDDAEALDDDDPEQA